MTRIYDDPNHRFYGPVRRLWVMLAGLGLLSLDDAFTAEYEQTWDAALCEYLGGNCPEGEALRCVLKLLLYLAEPII